MTDQQISNRGLEASRILESAVYREAMEAVRASIVAKWREVGVRDTEGQKLTHQLMTLAETFEGLLSGYVEAGKFSARKLDLDAARDESSARKIMRRIL